VVFGGHEDSGMDHAVTSSKLVGNEAVQAQDVLPSGQDLSLRRRIAFPLLAGPGSDVQRCRWASGIQRSSKNSRHQGPNRV
jgi:hypothetical protein